MLQALRGAAGSIFIKALFGLLLLSFLFFGVSDVFRTPGTGQHVATVGGTKISSLELDRSFQRDLERLRRQSGGAIDTALAKRMGLMNQSLDRLINERLLELAAKDAGINIDDAQAVTSIRQTPAFQDPTTKQFDRYRMAAALQQIGYTEQGFVQATKADLSNGLLLESMAGGPAVPARLVEDLYRVRNEKRVAELLVLKNDSATGVAEPSDEVLAKFHQDRAVAFTRPELRTFTLLSLTPDTYLGQVQLTDDDVRQAYEARKAEFVKPERRRVEQLVLGDKAQADAALAVAKAKGLAEAARSAKSSVVALDPMPREELPAELAEPVFAAAKGAVAGPVQSALGWHLFAVTEILPPGEIKFEDAKAGLETELRRDRAADLLIAQSQKLDDRISGGASIDEIAASVDAKTTKLGPVDAQGHDADGKPLAGAVPAALAPGFQLRQGDTSALTEAGENSYLVIRADTVTPAALKPLAEIRPQVVAAWKAEQKSEATAKKAATLAEAAKGGATLASLEKDAGAKPSVSQPFDRTGRGVTPALPRELVTQLFAGKVGTVATAATADGQVIARLTEVKAADPAIDPGNLDQVKREVEGTLANDRAVAYAQALRTRYAVKIDQATLAQLSGAGTGTE